jgi:hypothetical protein
MTSKIASLFAKGAQVIQEQEAEIARLGNVSTKLAEENTSLKRERDVRALAKVAVDRGIIGSDFNDVEEWVSRHVKSDTPLEVVKQGMDYATSGLLNKEAAEDGEKVMSKGSQSDPISSLIMGYNEG